MECMSEAVALSEKYFDRLNAHSFWTLAQAQVRDKEKFSKKVVRPKWDLS